MAALGFWATARLDPSYIAVIEDDGTRHAAGDLLARVNQQAYALRALGLREGDAVAVCLDNRVELLEIYMAALQSGMYFVPIPSGAARPEIAHMLEDSGAKLFVVGAEIEDTVVPHAGPTRFTIAEDGGVASWRSVWGPCPASPPEWPIAGSTLIYTSGTTGVPRAVKRPLSRLSLEQVGKIAAVHLNAAAGIRPRSGATHLVSSPLYHSASLLWCVDHLHLGHTVSLMRKWSAEAMLERIERDRVTSSLMVPTHFHRLLRLPHAVRARSDVSSLRHVVHTGAQCPVPIKKQMLDWWGPVIYEVYGATEGAGTCVGPEEWLARPGTVGRSFGRIRILRDDGSSCHSGEPGTVFIRSASQVFEYQGDSGKTASTRRGNYFTVGDVGYLDDDGYLFLCGRSSDVIISGGVNIYPAQIEGVLASHVAVRDVAVIGVPNQEWGEEVTALVELEPGTHGNRDLVDELRSHCRTQLAALKCPRHIEFVDALPRGDNGKLGKMQLRDAYIRATAGARDAGGRWLSSPL